MIRFSVQTTRYRECVTYFSYRNRKKNQTSFFQKKMIYIDKASHVRLAPSKYLPSLYFKPAIRH